MNMDGNDAFRWLSMYVNCAVIFPSRSESRGKGRGTFFKYSSISPGVSEEMARISASNFLAFS